MAKKKLVSIIIPTFNEQNRVEKRFTKAFAEIKRQLTNFELIFVDDGSSDKTLQVLKKIAQGKKEVRVIAYQPNKGKGYAVKKGIEEARGEIVGFTDADFAVDLGNLRKTVDLIDKGSDAVIGNRKTDQAELKNKPDFGRRILSFIHSNINNFFLNMGPIKDTLCGYKFFKKDVVKELFKDLQNNRWFFDLEILIKMRQKNLKIIQLPVSWEEIRGSKVNFLSMIKSSLLEHIKIYLNFFNVKIFSAILLSFLIIGFFPFLLSPDNLVLRNGDFSDLVYPDYYFIKDSFWKTGQLPLWNPTLFSGIPEIANPQSPVIYPPNILALFLPINYSIIILLILHLLMAGIFLFKLAKERFRFLNLAAVVLSFGVVFSPYIWGRMAVGHISMVFAFCLVAPIIYYATSILAKFSLRNGLFPTLFLSLEYLNYPTIWYYTCFFGLPTLVYLFWIRKHFKRSFLLFLIPIISVLCIFPLFLIQLQTGDLITRTSLSLTELSTPRFSIRTFSSGILIPPNFYQSNGNEVWLYLGLFLLAAAIDGWFKLTPKIKIIPIIIGIFVLLITLGTRTPVFRLLVDFIPGFSYLRVSTRDWFVVMYLVPILAAYFIEKVKSKKVLFSLVIIIDLLFFSYLRLWNVPSVMGYSVNQDINSLLVNSDSQFRYYCLARCISGRDSITKDINTADGYHLIILKNYRDSLSKAANLEHLQYTGNIPNYEDQGTNPNWEELGQFSIKWIISPRKLEDNHLQLLKQSGEYFLYQNLKAQKRIRMEGASNNLAILIDQPNYIKIKAEGDSGKLIIGDSFHPDWVGYIDGVPTPINKYQNWAKEIDLPIGVHIVELKFEPFRLKL